MDRTRSYSYPYTTASTSRYASSHATSSAFSSSANPNEDWTKISDLAERRRIQNRIAQRNYRKKLKRRLEDLERRAASSSASPEQTPQELPEELSGQPSKSRRTSSQSRQRPEHQQQLARRQLSPERMTQHDRRSSTAQHSPRPLTRSPSPSLTFATYPPADTSFYTSFSQPQSYHSLPAHYGDYPYTYNYGQPYTPTLPAMLPSNGAKHEPVFGEEDVLSPFSMNYASMAGMEVPSTQDFWSSALHTPPLTDPFSPSGSRESSPCHLFRPATPESLCNSPPVFDLYNIADF